LPRRRGWSSGRSTRATLCGTWSAPASWPARRGAGRCRTLAPCSSIPGSRCTCAGRWRASRRAAPTRGRRRAGSWRAGRRSGRVQGCRTSARSGCRTCVCPTPLRSSCRRGCGDWTPGRARCPLSCPRPPQVRPATVLGVRGLRDALTSRTCCHNIPHQQISAHSALCRSGRAHRRAGGAAGRGAAGAPARGPEGHRAAVPGRAGAVS